MKPLMNRLSRPDQRMLVAGHTMAIAALALTAISFASAAKARDNVTFSFGIGVPGVVVGATNAYPVYSHPRPVYVQPRPVYVQPAPVYYQPAPVYYAAPQPVYVGRPHGWKHGHYKKQDRHHAYGHGYNRGYNHSYYQGYNQGYQGHAPVYYQR